MEKIKFLNKLFSTADAEDVEYSSDGYELILKFKDWQEKKWIIVFDDVEYLKVSDYINDEKYRYDSPQQVMNSELIRQLNLDEGIYKHYMLCFNAWSNMEIISQELKIKSFTENA